MTYPIFDSVGGTTLITSGSSVTGAFNNANGDIMFALVGGSATAPSQCTGVTYNGVALVKTTGGRVGTAGRDCTVWEWDYLTNGPAPKGTYNIIATFSASQTFPNVTGFSYRGFNTTDPIGAILPVSAIDDTDINVTLTTESDQSLFLLFGRDSMGGATYTVTEGDIRLNSNASGWVAGDVQVPTAGAKTFTLSQGTTKTTIGMAIELKGIVSAPTAPSAFTAGQWSVADLATGGDIRVTLTSLPSNGGSAITGLEYQLNTGSWISLGGTTTGTYDIAGLTDNVSYNLKIRAVNAVGNGSNSDTKTVTPTTAAAGAPTVTSQTVTSVGQTTATGNGNVVSDGGSTVTERGVCISTSPTPTTADTKFTSAGTTGTFTASITGLTPSTLYYVRAYAINSEGTSYGTQVSFTTDSTTPPGEGLHYPLKRYNAATNSWDIIS